MKKINVKKQSVCIEELVKQRPVLTEEGMNEFCSYEEIVSNALRLFDEEVQKIWKEYDSKS